MDVQFTIAINYRYCLSLLVEIEVLKMIFHMVVLFCCS